MSRVLTHLATSNQLGHLGQAQFAKPTGVPVLGVLVVPEAVIVSTYMVPSNSDECIKQSNFPKTFQRCLGIRMCQTRRDNLLTGTVVSSKIRCGECLRWCRS